MAENTATSVQPQVQTDVTLAERFASQLEEVGFVVVPDFFPLTEVDAARVELAQVLETDLRMRKEKGSGRVDWDGGPTPSSSLSPVMHTVLFPTIHSPILSRMIERILTDPMSSSLLRKAVGNDFRLRVDLVRRSTGVHDVGQDGDLPHPWHRDRPGEFTCGIFFDDLSENDNSATAGVPGTHMLPFSPLWDFMLSRPAYLSEKAFKNKFKRYLLEWFFSRGVRNLELRKYFEENGAGMLGKQGDFYIFFNDIWHGRQANLFGKQLMMVRFGGFASDFAFPEDIPLPVFPAHVPDTLRRRYGSDQPVNTSKDSILQRMQSKQRFVKMFMQAHEEKQRASRLSNNILTALPFLNLIPSLLARPKR